MTAVRSLKYLFLSVHMAIVIRLVASASLIRYTGVGEAG